jgi:hypothetical protein
VKKVLIAAAAILAVVGCSNDNKIVFSNDAEYSVYFNFRAQDYRIYPGNSTNVQINDIPNGTYDFSLGYEIPPTATSWSISSPGGSLTFQKKSTKIAVSFGSIMSGTDYKVTFNYSSSDPTGVSTAQSVTGP